MHLHSSINVIAFACTAFLLVNGQHEPHFRDGRRAIVQLFEWKFVDIANECETFLAKHNFAGIQISPVNENIVIENRPWWERYRPMSFKILTRSGNPQEFLDMTRRCNNAGIRVYVDIQLNHMAAGTNVTEETEMIGTAQSIATYKNYPSAGYSIEDFHWSCPIESYQDAYQVRNCELLHMPDLDHSSPYVRGKIVSFMNYLIDLGVAGFRVSSCKHMWPNDLKEIYDKLKDLREDFGFEPGSRPFIMQEVLDFGREPISKTEYTSFGVVTEFLYARDVSNIFIGQNNISDLLQMGPERGFLQSDDAIVFIDNADTQRGFSVPDTVSLNFKSKKEYIMATAFLLAYPYGTIRIMSSYNFTSDINQGPPMDGNEEILPVTIDDDGVCGNGWVCEHRWKPIVEMVKFRVNVFGASISKRKVFGSNTIAFCREDKGFVAFSSNNFDTLIDEPVFVCVSEGRYCDVIVGYDENGNCSSVVAVDDNNQAVLIRHDETNDNGVIAIHVGSRIES